MMKAKQIAITDVRGTPAAERHVRFPAEMSAGSGMRAKLQKKLRSLEREFAKLHLDHARGIKRAQNFHTIEALYSETLRNYERGSFFYNGCVERCVIALLGFASYEVPELGMTSVDLVKEAIKKTEAACDLNDLFGKQLLAKCYVAYGMVLVDATEREKVRAFARALDSSNGRYQIY